MLEIQVMNGISNHGTLTINGGRIISYSYYALSNQANGIATISGTAELESASTSSSHGCIYNIGIATISGGTIKSSTCGCINNSSSGRLEINGPAEIKTTATNRAGVTNGSSGTLSISAGKISSVNGIAIQNQRNINNKWYSGNLKCTYKWSNFKKHDRWNSEY